MPKLKKFRVDIISVLKTDGPANGKNVIYKSSDDADFRFTLHLKNLRKDSKEGLIFGTVYGPDEVDTQGDWADRDSIRDAAHLFLTEKRVNMIDIDHSYEPGEGTVVESFIKNGPDTRFPDAADGSWCVVIKLSDAARANIDEIKGLSMAGGGMYDLEAMPPKSSDANQTQVSSFKTRVRPAKGTPGGTRIRPHT